MSFFKGYSIQNTMVCLQHGKGIQLYKNHLVIRVVEKEHQNRTNNPFTFWRWKKLRPFCGTAIFSTHPGNSQKDCTMVSW